MTCDAPPRRHARRSDMCTRADSHREGLWRRGRVVRLYLSAWLLTVNMKLLFSKHSSGKGNPCVIEFAQQGDAEQIEGWERSGVTPDRTSFNHVRVCNHFMHIFGCVGDRSCFCTNCTQQEGLLGGKTGMTVWQRKQKWPFWGFWDLLNWRLNSSQKSSFCCCCSCRTFETTWNLSLWKYEHCAY